MSINEPSQMTSRPGVRPEGRGLLRTTSVIAVVVGAAGSVSLTVYAGRHSDSLTLKVLFALWVLSPFLGLNLAGVTESDAQGIRTVQPSHALLKNR